MREIKFRAWDKKEQCWVSSFSIHNYGLFSDMIKGEINKSGVCVANCNWQKLNELQHIEVMQYTGLKDKNETEIYEGDILQTTLLNKHIGKVFYENGSYYVLWVKNNPFEGEYKSYLSRVNTKCEVIGNIYQHPQLLGDSDSK